MVKKKVDQPDFSYVDNRFELAAYLFSKHFWKLVVILTLIAAGVVFSGFSIKWGEFSMEKEGPRVQKSNK
jgi:hypothetical protein